MSRDDFNWDDESLIVQREQPEVAVYPNTRGDLVIRKKQDWPHEDADTWIVIGRENVAAIARAMLGMIGIELSFDKAQGARAGVKSPKSNTGAQRQKRYRDRHSNGSVTDESVTRNGASVTHDRQLFTDRANG